VVAEGSEGVWAAVQPYLARARNDRAALREIERDQIGEINYRIEQARLGLRKLELEHARQPGTDVGKRRAELEAAVAAQQALYQAKQQELQKLVDTTSQSYLTVAAADGQQKELRTLDVFRAFRPNRLTLWGRLQVYTGRLWEFVSGDPRESNTEGGIFPAIFGTVMMVMIMSVAACPSGSWPPSTCASTPGRASSCAAFASRSTTWPASPPSCSGCSGWASSCTSWAGPSTGLLSRGVAHPDLRHGGILWASLTLALLTVPVVIVAAEEALSAVPRSMREASLAAGATKWQTIQRVVLPAAAPGILTGSSWPWPAARARWRRS
jgi:phosphate transport system permease protein